jgi:hypothetical protein
MLSRPDDSDPHPPGLAHIVDQLAHLLPAQGPISIFIHHNTLHAFEDLPFESAVERAAGRFGCQPFLSEEHYRAKVAAGRILAKDVESLLAEELGPGGGKEVAGVGTRLDLWRRIVLHGIPIATGRRSRGSWRKLRRCRASGPICRATRARRQAL